MNVSDTGGAFMFVECRIANLSSHDDLVAITHPSGVLSWVSPGGCASSAVLVLPGSTQFVLAQAEEKTILYRVRFECHSPASPGVVPVTISVSIDHHGPCGADDTNPGNDSVSMSDNITIGAGADPSGTASVSPALTAAPTPSPSPVCTPTPTSSPTPSPTPAPPDSDGDGFADDDEASFIGTDPTDPCGIDAWPADLVVGTPLESTNRINLADLMSFVLPIRRVGSSPGSEGFDARWDIVPGPAGPFSGYINIADLQKLVLFQPAMLGGNARAFNGPDCPWPP